MKNKNEISRNMKNQTMEQQKPSFTKGIGR